MIELKELTLGYGQRTLLKTVNARITGGQLVALLGRNGTGKVPSYVLLWDWKVPNREKSICKEKT